MRRVAGLAQALQVTKTRFEPSADRYLYVHACCDPRLWTWDLLKYQRKEYLRPKSNTQSRNLFSRQFVASFSGSHTVLG